MAKRKQQETAPDATDTPSKRRRKAAEENLTNGFHQEVYADETAVTNGTPKRNVTPKSKKEKSPAEQ